ncbi:uncharacterized protein LTR77_010659 [Saxophila tyrrhenica]|uniref:Triacylglycerol lipase n=1 Tax=Saxophila tyrrhenica TaxID=1690608 RepID=A0AAV9NV36_9PEZI|nr:hypothetical protein LTR77_010659 [Saxophila tyrrhenica]
MQLSYVFKIISFLALATASTAAPTTTSTLLPPSKDPWYTAPDGFEHAAPGDVLRFRKAPGNLTTTTFGNASCVYNILYRTTNARYHPSWAVTTLFVPKETNGSALLSYQIPYNSVDVDSSPSFTLHGPVSSLGLIQSDIQTALSLGRYVSVPDFEGPTASFFAGVQEGHATIDNVRAVLNHGFGLKEDARYAMWGYSGGSVATEWAAELQVQYAPEMHFAGAAMGGVVSNVTSGLHAADGTRWAGLVPGGLLGITDQYPQAREYLLSQLKTEGPYNKTGFLATEKLSIADAFTLYFNQTVFNYFKNGKAVLISPLIQRAINDQGYMGYHGVPIMPMLMYKAVADEITAIEDTDVMVDEYCKVGANIVYERNTIGGHLAEETNGDQRALEWLTQVLSGTYHHKGCTVKNVALNVTDSPL